MNSKETPGFRIETTRRTREFMIFPPRRSVRIEDGDWNRWVRSISSLPRRNPLFRDIAFSSIGIAVPSLITSFITWRYSPQLGAAVPFVYLAAGLVFLIAFAICLLFDQKINELAQQTVADILLDMREVHERAIKSEELVDVRPPISRIG